MITILFQGGTYTSSRYFGTG